MLGASIPFFHSGGVNPFLARLLRTLFFFLTLIGRICVGLHQKK